MAIMVRNIALVSMFLLTILQSKMTLADESRLLTLSEAQTSLFSKESQFKLHTLSFNDDTLDTLKEQANVRIKIERIKAWQVSNEVGFQGWFFVDQVIGKHEFITYALAVNSDGSVRGLEILEYLETHGGEVKRVEWRKQFMQMSLVNNSIKLGEDIDGISGATLSCRNVSDGVRKLLYIAKELSTSL